MRSISPYPPMLAKLSDGQVEAVKATIGPLLEELRKEDVSGHLLSLTTSLSLPLGRTQASLSSKATVNT